MNDSDRLAGRCPRCGLVNPAGLCDESPTGRAGDCPGVILPPTDVSEERPIPCCDQSQGVRFSPSAVLEHRWWLDVNGPLATVHVLVSFCPWCGKRYERAPG